MSDSICWFWNSERRSYCGHDEALHANNALEHSFIAYNQRAFDINRRGDKIGRVLVQWRKEKRNG